MPIFYSNVNGENRAKLVPITRQIGTSIIPDYYVNTLKLEEGSPENGVFWASTANAFFEIRDHAKPGAGSQLSTAQMLAVLLRRCNTRHITSATEELVAV